MGISGWSCSISSAIASSACKLAWMSEMTATRMGFPLRLATLTAAAGGWAAAAFFLWDSTKVPDDLKG